MSLVAAAHLSTLEPDRPVQVVIDGVPVALVRTAGTVFAIEDRCSHADVALSEGEVAGCTIECWLHGSSFDLRTGRPLSLPAITPVPVFPVTLDGDDVLVDVTTTLAGTPAPAENPKES